MSATLDAARLAKERAKAILTDSEVVNGIGITGGEGGYAVKVNLKRPLAAGEEIPGEIDGVPVITEVTGPIRKLPS